MSHRALIALVAVLGTACQPRASALPVLWQLPAWELTAQDGRTYGARELRGKVYVADFIFTQCVSSCPVLSRRMAQLQSRFAGDHDRVKLVSISVDPQDDTPARLTEYGHRYGADPAFWTFVTGPTDDVLRAIDQGFKVDVMRPVRATDGTFNPIELAHSNRFALVDAEGKLRASYVIMDDEDFERLVHDVGVLVHGAPRR